MAKTVIGLFDSYDEAQRVIRDLVNSGFSRDDIGLVANDQGGTFAREVGSRGTSATGEAVGAGAMSGSVVGGVLGLLVGTGLLIIPGIGPVLAAGPLAAAIGTASAAVGATAVGAGIGAASGGLLGALVGAGIPEEEAGYYAEGVRRGGTLVTISAQGAMADQAYTIMQQHGAVDVTERSSEWRESGWESFDPTANPYLRNQDSPLSIDEQVELDRQQRQTLR
jgi:hypothetical protein